MNADQLKREKVIEILKEWASQQENFKYHLNWISRLNTETDEDLYTSYKELAPNSCVEYTSKRISYLLLK